MLLIVTVAVVTKTVSLMLEFKHFCMHDFEWNINDRNWEQLFPCYPRQCLGIAPPKWTIKFLNVKAVHLKLNAFILVHPQEKGRYYLSWKFELQILNISRVIMSEMWKIGLFKNPRKMALIMFLLHILITYTKQYNRTIKRRRKPIKDCLCSR